MRSGNLPHLSVFDTFKTKTDQLTGEATRQRYIISILASNSNPLENTRTAIAKIIAKKNKISWKNIYSGVFRDFDEILLPLGLVVEGGRLPLKRGPKALQEKGVPYYRLTQKGIIVVLSYDSKMHESLLGDILKNAESDLQIINTLSRSAPGLVFHIFENYVRGYCDGRITELVPFSIDNIRRTQGETLSIYKELLTAAIRSSKSDRDKLSGFLDSISLKSGPAKH